MWRELSSSKTTTQHRREQLLDPAWTPEKGYSHAARLLAILNTSTNTVKMPTEGNTQYPAEAVRWRETPDSSNVVAVGWDDAGNMYAHFRSGSIYLYVGVSRQRAVACAHAASVGHYFNSKIKPNYKAVKIG
jgi:hypothetical protein